MAATTADAFNEFHERIKLSQNQLTTIASRREVTHGYLKSAFGADSNMPLNGTFLIGSAQRKTIVRPPFDDVDVLAIFQNRDGIFETYRHDSQKFLYRVRNALNTYQVQVVGARGQAVRLFYQSAPNVDIAPVFKWSTGGYALPAGDGTWLTTDPFVQAKWINERDQALGHHLKRIVRMLKQWNRSHSSRLKSFHLEVMAASLFSQLGSNSRQALHVFFEHASSLLSVHDPAGYGGDLSGAMTLLQKGEVIASFGAARDRAKNALDAEAVGDHKEAIRLWRIVLGEQFPSYG